jgi:Zn-dependent protease with chaperone function
MSEIASPLPPPAAQPVSRWETEIPLLVFVALAAAAMWLFLFISIIGIVYAVFFGVFFFLVHLGFIAHLRGSAVKLGPEQMPDLYARVQNIARRFGMEKVPDTYLMQAGGSLNALATKLFGSNFIVLYSDLLEACKDDQEAADFIIAHEIGHLKAGHLRFNWFLILGKLIPFLGGAYSRACEYTADRYGFAAVGNRASAVHGLTVLSAGGTHAKKVNMLTFTRQRNDMTGVLMTLGSWLSTHPPIVDRVAEADRNLAPEPVDRTKGILGALAVIVLAFMLPSVGGGVFFVMFMKKVNQQMADIQSQATQASALPAATETSYDDDEEEQKAPLVADPAMASQVALRDLQTLAATAERYRAQHGRIPGDQKTLYVALRVFEPAAGELRDPFDGERYGYRVVGDSYEIYSYGDGQQGVTAPLVVKGK